jgi:hypothetical protein
MPEIDPRILLAEMLIGLGLTTVETVKHYFTQNSDDDAELAKILSEVDARLARRGIKG